MEYANKIAVKFVVIIGEEEELQNKLSLKNMQTGEQKLYTEEEMILALSKELSY